MDLHPQYLIDEHQQTTGVLLSPREWQMILEELEELEDIKAYDAAKASPQEEIPFDQVMSELGIDLGQ